MYIGIIHICTPAFVYLLISLLFLIIVGFQNYGNTQFYCLGNFSCNVPNTFSIFAFKIIYILFWTWILNIICKSGFRPVSWFLVLFPFLIMFILLAYMMINPTWITIKNPIVF